MLIGILGFAGSGKDTIADILVRDHGFCKVALADPLKRICRDVYAFTVEQLWGPSAMRNAPDKRYPREHGSFNSDGYCACCGYGSGSFSGPIEQRTECYLTPRFALQRLGSEWGRDCYDNTWVDLMIRTAAVLSISEKHAQQAYSQVRGLYPLNEAPDSWEHPKGVVCSDIRFPNEVDATRAADGFIWKTTYGEGLQGAAGSHVSESHIDSITPDRIVPRSALEAMPEVVAQMLQTLKESSK